MDKKLVIFGHHIDVLDLLEKYLKDKNIGYVRIDGRTPNNKRQDLVDKFQKDPNTKIFLGGISATGLGITLTSASDSLFIERVWTPAVEEQAEDRLHRISQKNAVIAWYMSVSGTIDDKLAKIVNNKRDVISQLFKKDQNNAMSIDVINDLLDSYYNE